MADMGRARRNLDAGRTLGTVCHDRKYVRSTLKLAFLAPDIQRAILTGRQPKTLTLTTLSETELPMLWAEQRTLLRTA